MKITELVVDRGSGVEIEGTKIIICVRNMSDDNGEVVVGYPGLPNVVKELYLGDTILFESPADGICEIRAMNIDSYSSMSFHINHISPRSGILGGLVDDNPLNTKFTKNELEHVAGSINKVKEGLAKSNNISKEQFQLIERKLDEIKEASARLGRKDWMHLVAGTISSLCISASFSPEVTSEIFHSINNSFTWIFENGFKLLT